MHNIKGSQIDIYTFDIVPQDGIISKLEGTFRHFYFRTCMRDNGGDDILIGTFILEHVGEIMADTIY